MDGTRQERIDRIVNAVVAIVPFLATIAAGVLVWSHFLHARDLVIVAVGYLACGMGITVGFHRLFTHRSFAAGRLVRFTLAVLGSMAIEGPVIEWVANHRQHHAYSDREGDPHSPHGHGHGLSGALRGLWHAHMGWVFADQATGDEQRYARDLRADPTVALVDRTFIAWALLGLALPFVAGWAWSGTLGGGLEALLWGGWVRLFLLHHVTFSINSLCHFFGTQPYRTDDESRNLGWLSALSLGESWHNNHHAFPTSARHGLGRRQLDLSAAVITALERLGLARDVVRVTPPRQQAKARTGA